MYNNKTSIFPLMVFCLETDMITIPHTNNNLYSVAKFIVFKISKDLLTRTEVIALIRTILSTDGRLQRQRHVT